MSNKLDFTDANSLLKANAAILAGSLIFLALLRVEFDGIVAITFLLGTYFLIGSIFMCLVPGWVGKHSRPLAMEWFRRGFCIGGLTLLFLAMTCFLALQSTGQ